MRSRVSVIAVCALGLLHGVLLALFIIQAIREDFVNYSLLEFELWSTRSSGISSMLRGIRGAFSSHPRPSFLLFRCGPPLLFVYFQVNNGLWYFLDILCSRRD